MAMSKPATKPGATVGSAEFKARCLELVDRVKESRAEFVVTRHGKPVAKLVPVDAAEPACLIGAIPNSVQRYEAPFDPVPGVWTIAGRKGDA
jgi:prevent-host-death family protein